MPNPSVIDPKNMERIKAAAEEAAGNRRSIARAPRVGAAVLSSDGRIFSGSYITGATCYTTVHAEAAAIIQALSGGAGVLVGMALYAARPRSAGQLQPCGTCLQFLAEHGCGPDLWILTRTAEQDAWECVSLGALLPRPWRSWPEGNA